MGFNPFKTNTYTLPELGAALISGELCPEDFNDVERKFVRGTDSWLVVAGAILTKEHKDYAAEKGMSPLDGGEVSIKRTKDKQRLFLSISGISTSMKVPNLANPQEAIDRRTETGQEAINVLAPLGIGVEARLRTHEDPLLLFIPEP